MRVVFLGTPDFAVPSLDALVQQHQVAAVFTQPDRPKGRGNQLAESPVKLAAMRLGIPLHQPERIRRAPNPELLLELGADVMVVVGYGQIIPQSIIDIPPHGILNVHASLLPKYRGAAPIQWAIANGETETGVTIMRIDAGLDTGDMLLKQTLPVLTDQTAPELNACLAPLGAELLLETMRQISAGTAHAEKQDDALATLAPILKKEDGLIDWRRPAETIYNRLRGFTPWPGAYTTYRGAQLLITRVRPAESADLSPGRLHIEKRRLLVGAGDRTTLEILELQPAGKSRMTAEAFLNGYQPGPNQTFGEPI